MIPTDTTAIKIGDPGKVMLPISLLTPPGIHAEPDTVYVSFVTEKLVHTSFVVREIEVKGLDNRHTLKLLPGTVTVTLLAPGSASESAGYDPMLYVDASGVIGAPQGYKLEVQVGNPPDKSRVEMIQIDPDRLDFILEEKTTASHP